MANIRLTQRAVDRLAAPDPSGQQKLYWFAGLPGFGVLVSGKTTAKSFIAQRVVGGKCRRVTIGSAAEITFEEARSRAQTTLDNMRQGVDPKDAPPAPPPLLTLQGALTDYLAAKGARLRPSTVEGYRSNVARYLGDWADLPIGSITGEMIEERHREIGTERGEASANGAMRTFSAIYNWAKVRNRATMPAASPTAYLKGQWYEAVRRDRLVKVDDLPRFWRALGDLDNAVARDYLRLLLLTGLRKSSAATLVWNDVDFGGRVIRIPGSRMKEGKAFAMPMSRPVRDLLVARRALGDAGFVFPSRSQTGHIAAPRDFLVKVAEESGVLVSPHDLRRTFASVASSTNGVTYPAIKALLAHSTQTGDVTSGYIVVSPTELAKAAELVGERMLELCGVEAPEGVALAG